MGDETQFFCQMAMLDVGCWMLDSGSEDFFRTEKKFGAKSLKYSVIRNFNGRKKPFELWEAVTIILNR